MKALRTLCIALVALMLCMMMIALGLGMFSNVLVGVRYVPECFFVMFLIAVLLGPFLL